MSEALPVLRGSDRSKAPFAEAPPSWAEDTAVSDFVLHLGSGEDDRLPEQTTAAGLMARLGVTSRGEWQHTEHSSSLRLTSNGREAWRLWQTLWCTLSAADVWVAPAELPPVKLLLCDMDSTLITTESLDELAVEAGIGEPIARITERAMNGELDFEQALNERVQLLAGLGEEVIARCVQQTQLSEGAQSLLATARQHGVRTVLISGGFTPFTDHVSRVLNMDMAVANRLEVAQGQMTGRVLPPIVTRDTKVDVLKQQARELGISPSQCVAMGDGANDIAMLQAAGIGIAYRGKSLVQSATPFHLNCAPLDVLSAWLPWNGSND